MKLGLQFAGKLLLREPNCVAVPVYPSCKVFLVGDVHGQFPDVLHLLEIAGYPSANRLFVFNADYVDRGAWGFETYFYLLDWKVKVMVYERDQLMVKRLLECEGTVVGVVGMAHMDGIEQLWKEAEL